MKLCFFKKIGLLIQSIKTFKNWYLLPIVYFKLTNQKYVIFETRNKIKMKLRADSTDVMTLVNIWLVKEYSKFGFEIKPKDVIIDVGSHIGLFALFVAQFCNQGKIYCFEPIKENFELLIDNLKLNKIENVKIFNKAISADSRTIKIYRNEDEAAHSMFRESTNYVEIESVSLKKVFDENKIEKCDLLKIDCEGAEYEIIESVPKEYFNKIKQIVIEYHFVDSKPYQIKNLKEKLTCCLFKIFTIENYKDMGMLYAIKQ